MEYLKAQWEYWGLQAPIFSWVVSACLLVGSLLLLFYFWVRARVTAARLKRARKKVQSLFGQNQLRAGEGLSLRLYDGLREYFNRMPSLTYLWHRIDAHIIQRPGQGGGDEFWLAEPIDTILNEIEVVETHYLKIAPGIITGLGLLATFMAILIALLDVKLVEDKVKGLDRIQGLGLLIQGLSGKFLSSVVALTCAVILLWFEKIVVHPAHAAFRALVLFLKERLPRITPAQILSDLHKEISKQSTAFAIFNADLALTLKKSFGESVGPTLERMVQAIDDLNQFLRAAEAKKQESMTGQLGGLLKNIEQSMQMSLEKMGAQFKTSLTGSTQTQFEKVTGSLGETASLLKEMNTQFAANQTMLNDLISHAKSTTAEQLTMGQTQIQQLTGLLKELMVQLQEKTGESIISVQQALAAVTTNICNKVSDLSLQMASIIEETSGMSTKSAKEIIDKAGTLNSRSAENLGKLLERHSAEITRVEDLRGLLDATIKDFKMSADKYHEITKDLRTLASEVNVTLASIAQTSSSIKDSQTAAAKVSQNAAAQIESLKAVNQAQKETWEGIQTSMTRYGQIFGNVDKEAQNLLTHIGQYLQDYSETTQDHFKKLGTIANEHIANATNRISGSIDELSQQLDELQGIVAGIARVSKMVSR